MEQTREPPGPDDVKDLEASAAPRFSGWMLGAVVPPLAAVALIFVCGVDVPIADEWSLAPGIARAVEGTTTFEDVWRPAAEHVAIVPRLVILGLARATSWNLRVQSLATVAFAVGTLLFLARILARAGAPPWSVALAACFVFSFHAHETFLWAYQLHIAMALFGTVGALTMLSAKDLRPGVFSAALLLACVASWSFLNGYLVWPVGALVIALRRYATSASRLRLLAVWLGLGIVLVAVALLWIQPRRPATTATASVLFEFASRWIGAGLVGPWGGGEVARIAGWTGIAIVIAAMLAAVRRRETPAILSLAAIGGFGLASAAMVAVGRFALGGLASAQSSRYTSFSGLVWLVVAVLPGLVVLRKERGLHVAQTVLAGAVALVLVSTELANLPAIRELSANRRQAARALLSGEGITWAAVETLFAAPDELIPVLADRVAMMRRLRLSLFRNATAADLDPPRLTGPFTAKMTAEPTGGRQVSTVRIAGGAPGNLAFVLIVAGAAVRSEGPWTLDSTGCAVRDFELLATPEGALYHALSLDRLARVITTEPAPVPR